MKKVIQVRTILVAVVLFLLCPNLNDVLGQRRRPARSVSKPAVDYSAFSHSTKKHQQACVTCHKVPTKNWQRVSQFPDIVDYPGHEACVSCHRPQFFRGAKPPICTVCHTQVGPRAEERFAFRNPNIRRQFLTEFPHDKHQDVIARTIPQTEFRSVFRTISFRSADGPADAYNNCTICHTALITLPAARTWTDGYKPDALTFKNAPSDHASCFNCHWKAQKPINENCDGCHKLSTSPYSHSEIPNRISLKFRHDGGGEKKNHVAECTTCHINITKSATLRGLKPDVPITSCTECHNKDGLRLDVSGELAQVDKNRDFVCVYCHTSDVGRRDPPASHYLIAGREPLTRKSIK
jgi:Outer membrane cytochrome MtrC/MtrF-like, domains II/IV